MLLNVLNVSFKSAAMLFYVEFQYSKRTHLYIRVYYTYYAILVHIQLNAKQIDTQILEHDIQTNMKKS